MPGGNESWAGSANWGSAGTEYDQTDFIVRAIMSGMATVSLVQVVDVNSAGELAEPGLIDIHPMVAQIDGFGNATPHGVIHNVPYFRLQAGGNAVIMDPVVGDIGIALFSSHDISSVVANKAPANPGSRRRFAWADALYLGGVLNQVPSQFIRFSASGIQIVSPTGITITAPSITLNGNIVSTGTLQNNSKNVGSTHTHGGVTTGGGTTGAPT